MRWPSSVRKRVGHLQQLLMKGSPVTVGRMVDDSDDRLKRYVLPLTIPLHGIRSGKFGGGLLGNPNRLGLLDVQNGCEIFIVPASQECFLSDHRRETLPKSLHGALDYGTGIDAFQPLQLAEADQEHAEWLTIFESIGDLGIELLAVAACRRAPRVKNSAPGIDLIIRTPHFL